LTSALSARRHVLEHGRRETPWKHSECDNLFVGPQLDQGFGELARTPSDQLFADALKISASDQ
jgi:hypothetical protein